MNRLTPACLAARTIGSNASMLREVDSVSSSSKLASLEMQARLQKASCPGSTAALLEVSRMSHRPSCRLGLSFGREATPKTRVAKGREECKGSGCDYVGK